MSSEVARLCRSESTNRNRGNAGAWRDGVAPKPADTDTVSSVATKELRPPRPSSSIRTRSLHGRPFTLLLHTRWTRTGIDFPKNSKGPGLILPRDITQSTMARLCESELATRQFHPPVAKNDGSINPQANTNEQLRVPVSSALFTDSQARHCLGLSTRVYSSLPWANLIPTDDPSRGRGQGGHAVVFAGHIGATSPFLTMPTCRTKPCGSRKSQGNLEAWSRGSCEGLHGSLAVISVGTEDERASTSSIVWYSASLIISPVEFPPPARLVSSAAAAQHDNRTRAYPNLIVPVYEESDTTPDRATADTSTIALPAQDNRHPSKLSSPALLFLGTPRCVPHAGYHSLEGTNKGGTLEELGGDDSDTRLHSRRVQSQSPRHWLTASHDGRRIRVVPERPLIRLPYRTSSKADACSVTANKNEQQQLSNAMCSGFACLALTAEGRLWVEEVPSEDGYFWFFSLESHLRSHQSRKAWVPIVQLPKAQGAKILPLFSSRFLAVLFPAQFPAIASWGNRLFRSGTPKDSKHGVPEAGAFFPKFPVPVAHLDSLTPQTMEGPVSRFLPCKFAGYLKETCQFNDFTHDAKATRHQHHWPVHPRLLPLLDLVTAAGTWVSARRRTGNSFFFQPATFLQPILTPHAAQPRVAPKNSRRRRDMLRLRSSTVSDAVIQMAAGITSHKVRRAPICVRQPPHSFGQRIHATNPTHPDLRCSHTHY
ncbi:uncharacterized protein CLUP02_07721 [Colletotrichum lupini]|uniref:Uncharacterized protein n=1 Tax=Colletotrichum lupini TaxID=145971 RepID=A0A9Q8SRJ3_9PEZI|nr:uncharacterized protein CLUP02_07721 [Colletotrichum lupini]UQC82234.1 hypothetical protein CLUP02_07721 [Colletotrichum lupini]